MRAALLLLIVVLLAAPAALRAQPPAAAASQDQLDAHWSGRLEDATKRLAEARIAVPAAEAAVGEARHRRYPRGEALGKLERNVEKAREELARAEEELPALLEKARVAGASPGVLQRFESAAADGAGD
jgi:chromosome segregation ATPase